MCDHEACTARCCMHKSEHVHPGGKFFRGRGGGRKEREGGEGESELEMGILIG